MTTEIEVRPIEDRASWLEWRQDDMTASVGPCLFGGDVYPYSTAYQQWAIKSGLVKAEPIDPKLARRGHYIERIAPEILAEERPDWKVTANPYYYRDPVARIGATPDLWAYRPDIPGTGVVDIKSVGPQTFRKWRDRDTGDTELPVWMAIQVNIQAALVGAHWETPTAWGAVAAITIGDQGLDCEIIDVPILPGLYENFRGLVKDFWRRVEEKDPYPIDWGKDAATILDMYRDDDGGLIDLTQDDEFSRLLLQRGEYKTVEMDGKRAEALRRLIDAQIINRMGNAATARFRSALIKAPTIRVKEAVRKAYSFRRISVTGDETREAPVTDDVEG